MAKLTISTHFYEKTEITKLAFDAYSFQPTSTSHIVREVVHALFEIEDGEAFPKIANRPNGSQVMPQVLKVEFTSDDGGAWQVAYGVTIEGRNVKKDGSLGAACTVYAFDFPAWVKAFYEKDGDSRSDALDWVRAEYSR